VLDAAFDVLTSHGFECFTIADVAARAGVHETSIYRRWQTRGALALEACLRVVGPQLELPDTGALAKDLKLFLRRLIKLLESPSGRALLAVTASDPEGIKLRENFWAVRLAAAAAIVERAKLRKELPERVDARVVLETLAGPIYFRLMLTGESLKQWPLDEVVDRVVAGFRS
jgi:AcrR family transcriptional regulator